MEPGVSLEAASLFVRGRGKTVYILTSSNPTLSLLLVGFTMMMIMIYLFICVKLNRI
ncbi:hypothetical protein Hanom_Chr10g00882781 [Helianthus anomalus]